MKTLEQVCEESRRRDIRKPQVKYTWLFDSDVKIDVKPKTKK